MKTSLTDAIKQEYASTVDRRTALRNFRQSHYCELIGGKWWIHLDRPRTPSTGNPDADKILEEMQNAG